MNRRGFILVPVLWLLVAGAAITTFLVVSGRADADFARNRMLLQRETWGREACLAVLLGRWSPGLTGLDTVELGRGAWCTARVEELSARADVNHATPAALRLVLGSDSLADALLDWLDPDDIPRPLGAERTWYARHQRRAPRNGPIPNLAELHDVRGFEHLERAHLERLLAVGGDETVDLNAAPERVLLTVPGLGREAVAALLSRRAAGRPVGSAEELLSLLSRPGKDELLADYGTFLQRAGFQAGRLAIVLTGGIRGTALRSRSRVIAIPTGTGLTVLSQEAE